MEISPEKFILIGTAVLEIFWPGNPKNDILRKPVLLQIQQKTCLSY